MTAVGPARGCGPTAVTSAAAEPRSGRRPAGGEHHPGQRGRDQGGAEQVQRDQHLGQVGEVLHEADDALGQLARPAARRPRGRSPARPARQAANEQPDACSAEQQEDHVGVQLAEPRAGRARCAARRRRRRAGRDPVTTVPR